MPAQFFWKVLGVFVNLGGGQSVDEVWGKLLGAVAKSHSKKKQNTQADRVIEQYEQNFTTSHGCSSLVTLGEIIWAFYLREAAAPPESVVLILSKHVKSHLP